MRFIQPEVQMMTVGEFFLLLLIAAIVGALGRGIAGQTNGGCFTSMAIGLVGAVLGTWLARALGLPELLTVRLGGQGFPIVWSIIGAVLFVVLINLLLSRPRHVRV